LLAEKTGFNENSIVSQLEKGVIEKIENKKSVDKKENKNEVKEEELTVLVLSTKKPNLVAKRILSEIKIGHPGIRKILEEAAKEEEFVINEIREKIGSESKQLLEELYIKANEIGMESEKKKKEIDKIIWQIKEKTLKERISQLSGIIAKLEASKDKKALSCAENEYNQALAELSAIQKSMAQVKY
jgi:exoribonuclease R